MGSNSRDMLTDIAHEGVSLRTLHLVFDAWHHRDHAQAKNRLYTLLTSGIFRGCSLL